MALLSFVGDLIKKKAKVPEFKDVSLSAAQSEAIQANRSSFGEASALASDVNKFNQDQLMATIRELIPDADAILANISGNIADQTAGRLPDDVVAEIERTSAARAFAGGVGGSGFAKNLTTRDLGLNSLAMTQRGLDNASRWIATSRASLTAPQMDVTSMFVSPAMALDNQWKNTQAKFSRDWLNSQVTAQNAWQTSLGNNLQQTEAFVQGLAGAAVGLGGNMLMGGAGAPTGGAGASGAGSVFGNDSLSPSKWGVSYNL